MAGLATLLLDDGRELLDLALGAEEGAETLLGELLGLLVLRVTEELHNALLVGGETGDLADDRLDEDLLLAGWLARGLHQHGWRLLVGRREVTGGEACNV